MRDRERKLAEVERTKKELEEREGEERRRLQAEMDEMRRCVFRLEKELKEAKVGAPENVRRVKELERLNEALKQRRGGTGTAGSTADKSGLAAAAGSGLACVRIDIEAFDEASATFKPLNSTVLPDSLER
jgi:septal ring factor EnvC (AmiA/AmiB activator)